MPVVPVFPKGGGVCPPCPPCPPPAGAWVEQARLDMTGLDPQVITPPSAAGYQVTLTKSGAPFVDMYLDYSGSGLVFDVNASAAGVRADWVSGTSNYLSQTIKVNDLLGVPSMTNPLAWQGLWALQMTVDNITYPTQNAERFGFYLSSNYETMLGAGNALGSTFMDNGAGTMSVGLYNGTDVNEYLLQTQATAACFTIVLLNGVMTDQLIDVTNGGAFVDPYTADYGPMLVHRSPTQGIPYYNAYNDAYMGAVSRRKTNGTITGFRAMKFEQEKTL